MKKETKGQRESWTSRFGFIMATAGFAIGLGNIWRFPYITGNNGGGAFVLIYILICIFICVPLFLAEVGLGRKTQTGPVTGMRKLTKKGSPWVLIGWLGSFAATLIMSYYLMIMGWLFAYLFKVGVGSFSGVTSEQIASIYHNLISNPWAVLGYTAIPAVIVGLIVTKGVQRGIEQFTKVVMPILVLLLIFLIIYSFTLPGAMEGLKWYLTPDFSAITGGTFLAALGQAFFSIGIGMAAAFTYGSYLHSRSNLITDGILVISFDTFIAFAAGLVIFPALFAFNIAPDSGPGLLFLTIPKLLDQLPGGLIFGLVFFILVILASISTAVGFIETIASTTSELFKIKRATSVWINIGLVFLLAVPSILSQGPWSGIHILGKDLFDFIDYLSGNILLTLDGLLISLFVIFKWGFSYFKEDLNAGAKAIRVSSIWKPFVCVILPLAVAVILVTGLF